MKTQLKHLYLCCMLWGGMVLLSIPGQAMERKSIEKEFIELATQHQPKERQLAESLWKEIEGSYTEERRAYHNLQHLENFYRHLQMVKDSLDDYNSVFMAMIYHDIVYFTSANEENSAELAQEQLKLLGFPPTQIARVKELILATKGHELSEDSDMNYFLDADLSILGLSAPVYDRYTAGIIAEYGGGTAFLQGRKRFLERYLLKESLFMTDFFRKRYEKSARANILREIESLN